MNYSRRQFLAKAGAGASLLTMLSNESIARTYRADKKLRVALCGLGYYAEFKLAPGLLASQNCELVGIVTGTPAKAERWKKQFNIPDKNIYNYQNFDQIADNKDIDAVYTVLPNSMHHEFVIRTAKAGKHAICEKPMAINAKECQEMIDACKKANVTLSIGYRCHFEPYNMEAMRVGQQKILGKPKVVESAMGFKIGDPNQWRLKKALAGGGAMYDVGVYAIQGARYALGEEPTFVTAQEVKTDPVKFKEVDETIMWQMEFPSGARSSSITSYASGMDRLYISAEAGWLELGPAFSYGPQVGRTSKGPLTFAQTNHQAVMMDEIAAIIFDKKASTISGEKGLKDAKVMEAIYKSIESGKKVKVG